MNRQPYPTRTIMLRGPGQVERAIAALRAAPLDELNPIQLVLREEVKERKLTQQGLMWAGPLADIAEQVIVEGRRYTAEVWHEHMKALYLPAQFDAELCVSEDYEKWAIGPAGNRILAGSTTDLTARGMAQHIDQIHAFGGQHGVMFHEAPRRG